MPQVNELEARKFKVVEQILKMQEMILKELLFPVMTVGTNYCVDDALQRAHVANFIDEVADFTPKVNITGTGDDD